MRSSNDRVFDSDDTMPFDAFAAATDSLRAAMHSMKGYAEFAILESIYCVACNDFAFQGSMKFAADLLAAMPDVRIETASDLGQYRVFASRYWHPTGRQTD